MRRKPLPPDQKAAAIAARRAYKAKWQAEQRAIARLQVAMRPKGCNTKQISHRQVLKELNRSKAVEDTQLTKASVRKRCSMPSGILSAENRKRKASAETRACLLEATAASGTAVRKGTLAQKIERGIKKETSRLSQKGGRSPTKSESVHIQVSQTLVSHSKSKK